MPFGRENLHVSYATCFREKIGKSMISILDLLIPYGMSHLGKLSTWEVPLMSVWEDFFYELPFWRVIHFVWMITWRLELHMGMKVPYIFQIYPCNCLRTSNIWEGRIVIFLN